MKRIELVEFNAEILQKLQKAGVKIDDWRYVGMVKEYQELVSQGQKRTYAAMVASQHYGISTRKGYNLLQRLCAECKNIADG